MASKCFFVSCNKSHEVLITAGPKRIQTIIKCSKHRGEELHQHFEEELKCYPELTIKCHKSCVSSYTSNHHIARTSTHQPNLCKLSHFSIRNTLIVDNDV